jgi:hypothetical protein
METHDNNATPLSFRERLTKSWFAPVAAVGALAALVGASLRTRPTPPSRPQGPGASPAAVPAAGGPVVLSAQIVPALERRYTLAQVIGGKASSDPFRVSLSGIGIGAGDRIYALGDDEVRTYDAAGTRTSSWRVIERAACLTVGPDGRVYVGAGDRVEIYDRTGRRVGGFTAGDRERPADVTSIKVFKDDVLVADASARIIRRYDGSGRQRGIIGDQNKTGSFMLPNRSLDIAVDVNGVVRATDSGRHQVTSWALDGSPLGKFGKFGMLAPEDFVGCCNPVNIAVTPDGRIVTGEKMVARVKVFEPDGRLLALIGPEHFHPACTNIFLAVDSNGRIAAADPAAREVKIFSPVGKAGRVEPAGDRREAPRT